MSIIEAIRENQTGQTLATFSDSELSNLTVDDLSQSSSHQRLLNTISDPVYASEMIHAVRVQKRLESLIDGSRDANARDRLLSQQYGDIIAYLKLLALPLQSPREVEELFSAHLLLAFTYGGFSLQDKVAFSFLYHDFRPKVCEQFSQALLRGLKENRQLLGAKSITVDQNGSTEPTIKNWLRDYDLFTARPISRTALNVVTYLNQSSNVRLLDKSNRDILHSILMVYNYLRLPLEAKYAFAFGSESETRHTLPAKPL